jgi:hypothetical protein
MSLRGRIGVGFLTLGVGLLLAAPATAHTRSQSFSSWSVRDGEVRLSFSVQALEATRLGLIEGVALALDELLVKHLLPRIIVRAGGATCRTLTGPLARMAREGYLRVEWSFACPTTGPIEVANAAFFDVAPSHVHYARVRIGENPPVEYLFTNVERRRVISAAGLVNRESQGASFGAYVLLGGEHILIGADHLAFLLALLLLCRRVREVIFMVTGFTLGHSITLSLAVLGIVEPNVPVIEALIGFTIALVAAENVGVTTGASTKIAVMAGVALTALALVKMCSQIGLPVITLIGLALFTLCYLPLAKTRQRAARLRPLLTVLFGLIHGFGFASVLLEMGLPTDRLAVALLGFNLGVELGQLGAVVALWGVGTLAVRRVPAVDYRLASDAASAALCALGLFWFVSRAFAATS